MKRSHNLKIGFLWTFTMLMSGWATVDEVWQPSYPGAKELGLPGAGARGGPQAITVQINEDVSLSFTPVSIDRKESVRFTVAVAPGATLWLVSDQAKLEMGQDVVPAPIQFQGSVPDIATDQQQPGVYQLVGRKSGYSFVVPIDEKGDVFYLTLPILTDPDDDINTVRVRFDRRDTR
jgi:hypothetical protein